MTGGERADRPLVYLIAGEPSGDMLGARLMAALKHETGDAVRFAGVGGPNMEEAGLSSLFPMSELSVMGLTEVLPRLPAILARLRQTVADVRAKRPAVLVTVDSPDFNFRVSRRLKGEGVPLVHYVAPSVWAWRPGRAAEIARFLDHLMTLLPFEPPYFEAEGLASTFVGHSVLECAAADGDGDAFRQRHRLDPTTPLIAVLPGSRMSEVSRLLPVFADTLALLKEATADLQAVVAVADTVADAVLADLKTWPVAVIPVSGEEQKFAAFAAADVALAASGTVALELAMAGTPSIIAYRVNPLSGWLAKRILRTRFANLVNVVLDREAVPECLQEKCRPGLLAEKVKELLESADARALQHQAYGDAIAQLGIEGTAPSRRAAQVVLDVIGRRNAG